MQASKQLTRKAGLTIPKHIRAEAGWFPGMAMDIESTPEGSVLVKPHVPTCRFCGRPENIVEIADMDVCIACCKAIKKELEQHGA